MDTSTQKDTQKGMSKRHIELLKREERLKEKLKQTENEIAQRKRQRKEQERKRARAIETKKNELVGAMLLDEAKRDPQIAMELQAELDSFLVRDDDRALFGLPPLSEAASVNQGENPPEAENQAPKQESEEAETNFNPEPKPEKETVAQKSPSPNPKKTAKKAAKKAVKKTAKQTA